MAWTRASNSSMASPSATSTRTTSPGMGAVMASSPSGSVGSREPFARVVDRKHWEGLWRPHDAEFDVERSTSLCAMGRRLADYQAIIERGAA